MGSMMKPFVGKGEPIHWDLYRKTWANPKLYNAEIPPPVQQKAAVTPRIEFRPYQAGAAIAPTGENKTETTKPRRKGAQSSGTILVDEKNY